MADEKKQKSIDPATLEMLEKAAKDHVNTVFDRAEKMAPCPLARRAVVVATARWVLAVFRWEETKLKHRKTK